VSNIAISAQEFIELVAVEMASGVDVAVESWMSQVEEALYSPQLTTLGRMNSAKEVLARYRSFKGKGQHDCHSLRAV
jgi:hypothetical protein